MKIYELMREESAKEILREKNILKKFDKCPYCKDKDLGKKTSLMTFRARRFGGTIA